MSQMATPTETTQGYAPPTATQFSVFLENKVGRLLDLVDVFEGSSCRLCAISVHEASDHAVVRVLTNNAAEARKIFTRHQLTFMQTDVLVVALGPRPAPGGGMDDGGESGVGGGGGRAGAQAAFAAGRSLSHLCHYLLGAELNIRFAYSLMQGPLGVPAVAVAVDDLTLAGQILVRKEFRLLGEADLDHPVAA